MLVSLTPCLHLPSYWSERCEDGLRKSLDVLLIDVYIVHIVTVTPLF